MDLPLSVFLEEINEVPGTPAAIASMNMGFQQSTLISRVLKGLALERVIQIRVQAPQVLDEAGGQVHRDEQRPPALLLPNMHVLVATAALQACQIATQDHMAQRHGRGGSQHRQASSKEARDEPPVNLDCPLHDGCTTARQPGQQDQR
jgi:hypothetical protein